MRWPFALEKIHYDNKSGMVVYRSKPYATLKHNYKLMPPLKWSRMLMSHTARQFANCGQ
jgi:hypothetical protein